MDFKLITLGLTFIIFLVLLAGFGINDGKCNDYHPSNYTGRAIDNVRFFNNCYAMITVAVESYKTKEVCRGGIFGIGQSCYETEEPRWRRITKKESVCWKRYSGKRCENDN